MTNARKDIKGRIARLYATKITMALKADYYTKNFIAEKLKVDIDNGIKRITSSPVKEKPVRQYDNNRHGHGRKFDGKKRFNRRR